MFELGFPEIALIVIIAVIVIGPNELPRALAMAGKWIGKARGVMANVRTGFDSMVREAEIQEMEKKWADENARIMREHPDVEAGVSDEGEMKPLPAAKYSGGDNTPDAPDNSAPPPKTPPPKTPPPPKTDARKP